MHLTGAGCPLPHRYRMPARPRPDRLAGIGPAVTGEAS